MSSETRNRLAVDIGGTFTDVALETGAGQVTTKVLTTPQAPEEGVMTAVEAALDKAGLRPAELSSILHGTTLATNALIERKGALTALITTEGFRDSVEIAYENRFEQYDIAMEKPAPLVPRRLRHTVPERMSAHGRVLRPLDQAAVAALVPRLVDAGVESVTVGLLHAHTNPAHERRIRDILLDRCPGLAVSLSSEVSPELREYERLSTTCANAYVQPLMAGYLERLERALSRAGFTGALLMMTSGGGVIGIETARRFPVRLVESGPAGGAILAGAVAAECGLDRVVAFDMGGTTAKICLIDDGRPQTSRSFEVARAYRFLKGSGLPIRIPVIEMVEIGAGGGSIAGVDALGRVTVGPASAGAVPGPACYGGGGTAATVTDGDLVLGRIDPAGFAGGRIALDADAAAAALNAGVGGALALGPPLAALAVSEVVDENMASAARVHAIERGKDIEGRTLVAFGGAAPLHASRLAEKLGIERIVVPTAAGVGSAVGLLRAPVAYEVVRSLYQRLGSLDVAAVNAAYEEMRAEAHDVVADSAGAAPLTSTRTAYMRYVGQGHEIAVALPDRALTAADRAALQDAFDAAYRAQFGRIIPGLEAEVLTWALAVSTTPAPPRSDHAVAPVPAPAANGIRRLFDPGRGAYLQAAVHDRAALAPGMHIPGPAVIVEDETSTVVAAGFELTVNALGYLVLTRTDRAG